MALRSVEEYRESLRDGRVVVYRGELVPDVSSHPSLGRTIDHAAGLFAHPAEGPAELWSYFDQELSEEVSTYFLRPTCQADLRLRGDVIEETTRRSRSTLNIIKAVGTDALMALDQVTADIDRRHGTEYRANVRSFRAHCALNDLAMVLAATDPKGDRTLAPSEQSDPDQYLRVVREDADGIIVRGAKVHTTAAPSANEIIVLPCRAMGPADAEYALSFATPVNAPGLTLICHPLVDGPDPEGPVSSRNIEVETLTVFDDVHVPWERVFLNGQTEFAGAIAGTFANYHRYTAISYKPPVVDLLVGATVLAAEQLGIHRSPLLREKLGRLIVYGDLIRCARLAAAERSTANPLTGIFEPDSVANNAGKYHFSSGYHAAVAVLQDVAGGLIVTAPGVEDLTSPTYGALVDKYLAGADGTTGIDRWRLVQLVRDLTASEFGGYNDVVTLHGEGSQGAQLVQTVRDFDLDRCRSLVRDVLDQPLVRETAGHAALPS